VQVEDIAQIENEIIHSALFDSHYHVEIFARLRPHHFRQGSNARKIFELMAGVKPKEDLFGAIVPQLAIQSNLWEYVYGLDSIHHTTALMRGQIRALVENYNSHQIEKELEALQLDQMSNQERLDRAVALKEKYSFEETVEFANPNEIYTQILEDIENRKDICGWSWGIPELDRVTGGIEKQKTYVIGGLKKTGKTRFMINTIHSLFKQDAVSLLFSLEMNAYSIQQLILSRFSGITTDLYRFKIDHDPKKLVNTAGYLSEHGDSILVVDVPGLNDWQIREYIRHSKQRGVDVVFVDYLQRISVPEQETRAYAIQALTGRIADLARQEDVAIIFLSQLAQRAEGRVATIADLKESGGIGENVDCALMLTNRDRMDASIEKDRTNIILMMIEQRSGESRTLKMKANFPICEFRELDSVH
jgi:replicative DNA helicase